MSAHLPVTGHTLLIGKPQSFAGSIATAVVADHLKHNKRLQVFQIVASNDKAAAKTAAKFELFDYKDERERWKLVTCDEFAALKADLKPGKRNPFLVFRDLSRDMQALEPGSFWIDEASELVKTGFRILTSAHHGPMTPDLKAYPVTALWHVTTDGSLQVKCKTILPVGNDDVALDFEGKDCGPWINWATKRETENVL